MNVCTASGLSSLGTSLGLSQTVGYSPYLPLLALAIATKWFHLCNLNPAFGFITADWFLIVVALLTALDLVIDLIPGVSTGWHAVHTAITPFLGGLVAAATTTNLPGLAGTALSGSLLTTLPMHPGFLSLSSSVPVPGAIAPVIMFVVGFFLSGLVQIHRTGGRAVANVGHVFTLGLSNVIVSVVEDIAAVVGIVLSFLAPVFMLIIVICVVLFLLVTFRYVIRGFRLLRHGGRSSIDITR